MRLITLLVLPKQSRLVSADEMRQALLGIKRERDGLQRSWTLKDGVFCP